MRWLNPLFWSWICIGAGTPIAAQSLDDVSARLDSIHRWPAGIARDSALAYHFNYLAEAYSGQNDSLTQLYIDSLDVLRKRTAWRKAEGLFLRAQGKRHDRRGEFQQALELYSTSIDAFRTAGDASDFIAYTYILKAFVLNNNGLYAECERTLNEVRPIAEKLANKNFLAWIIDWYGDQSFYSSFGQQDFPKALGYYLEVEQLLPQVPNHMIHADNAHGLAGCYMRLGQEVKALEYRDRALELAREFGLHSVIFAVYGDMADVYETQGKWKEAIDHRLLALDYAKQSQWIEMEARALRTATYTYKAAGDYKHAFEYFEKLVAIEDSLNRFDVQTKYHELEARYASDKKDFEIQRLKANNLMLLIYVLAALLIGGTLFLLYYLRTNRQLRMQNKALINKNLEIQLAMTEGQNIERKRMAIELHDNINTKIAAAKWMLETINTPDKTEQEKEMIERLVVAMSDIYEDVRFISHNLVPKDIETKNLDELVSQLVQNLNHNQRIAFVYTKTGEEPLLEKGLKLQCYAMIMELVNNILKHSGCRHATIAIVYTPSELTIRVEDDGRGFDPAKSVNGVGLKNISSRIQSVHGQIQFAGRHGSGSVVNIQIPLNPKLVYA
jgi:signal transduction histidine kinase